MKRLGHSSHYIAVMHTLYFVGHNHTFQALYCSTALIMIIVFGCILALQKLSSSVLLGGQISIAYSFEDTDVPLIHCDISVVCFDLSSSPNKS